MPAWLIAIMSQLPNITAEILAIVQAAQVAEAPAMSSAQLAKLSAHLAVGQAIHSIGLYYTGVASAAK